MQHRDVRRSAWVVAVAATIALCAGCSDTDDATSPASGASPAAPAGSGPFFGRCGGVTTEELEQATGVSGLGIVTDNPAGCEWLAGGDELGPQFSFNWYRGSPIGRERATEQLTRDTTRDLTLQGHTGFIAYSEGVCEIGIPFGGDFFEWSVSLGTPLGGTSPQSTDQICAAATRVSTMTIERSR